MFARYIERSEVWACRVTKHSSEEFCCRLRRAGHAVEIDIMDVDLDTAFKLTLRYLSTDFNRANVTAHRRETSAKKLFFFFLCATNTPRILSFFLIIPSMSVWDICFNLLSRVLSPFSLSFFFQILVGDGWFQGGLVLGRDRKSVV